jgi:urease accessory protein
MADAAALLLALQMGDSAFPSGGFGFSWGLETLKSDGLVRDGADVIAFAQAQLWHRWASADRPVLRAALAARGDLNRLAALDREVEAMNLAVEQREGSRRMGRALVRSHVTMDTPGAKAFQAAQREGRVLGHLPVAQGVVWGGAGLDIDGAEAVSAFAVAAGVGQAAVRLALIGPVEAQAMIAGLRGTIAALLARPCPDRPHAFVPAAEIAVMRHESGEARLFAN